MPAISMFYGILVLMFFRDNERQFKVWVHWLATFQVAAAKAHEFSSARLLADVKKPTFLRVKTFVCSLFVEKLRLYRHVHNVHHQ